MVSRWPKLTCSFFTKLCTWLTYVGICHPALPNEKCLSKGSSWLNAWFIKITGGNRTHDLELVRRLNGDAIKVMIPKAFWEAVVTGKNKWARFQK